MPEMERKRRCQCWRGHMARHKRVRFSEPNSNGCESSRRANKKISVCVWLVTIVVACGSQCRWCHCAPAELRISHLHNLTTAWTKQSLRKAESEECVLIQTYLCFKPSSCSSSDERGQSHASLTPCAMACEGSAGVVNGGEVEKRGSVRSVVEKLSRWRDVCERWGLQS